MKKLIKILISFFYKVRFIGKCKINIFSNTIFGKCSFEGKNTLGSGTYFVQSSLGFGSYIGKNGEFKNCKIGKFCSIGSGVKVVSATHPTDLVSTHPAFYSNTFHFSYNHIPDIVEHLTTTNHLECQI